METILQLSRTELREELRSVLRESIDEIKRIPKPELLPDETDITGASQLTGLSKAQIYKLTMLKEIPYSKRGKKNIFSRSDLQAWMKKKTIPALTPEQKADLILAKTAKKQLRK